MPDINQNFSIAQGSDMNIDYDVGPDTTGLNLAFATTTMMFWTQHFGVPDTDLPPILIKDEDNGITITDPLFLKFSLNMTAADTIDLAIGNYYYKVKIEGDDGKIIYPTYGMMTILRSD